MAHTWEVMKRGTLNGIAAGLAGTVAMTLAETPPPLATRSG